MSSNSRAERTAPRAAGGSQGRDGHRVRRLVVGALALAGGGLAVWFLATGPLLGVRDVEVRGEFPGDQGALEADLGRAAGEGTIVRPSVGAIRQAAAAHPWVESVTVARDLPLGLVVRVTPTTPVAVATDGERGVLVGPDGRVLGPAPARAGLPRVFLRGPPPEAGEELAPETRGAVALAAAATPDVARRLRGLRMRDGRLVGRLDAGPELRLGAPDDVASKATALQALLSNLSADEEQAATYIDVSVPERPAVGGLASPDAVEEDQSPAEIGIDQ